MDGNTPIWQLTVDEFKMVMDERLTAMASQNTAATAAPAVIEPLPATVEGLDGIMKLFKVSKGTATRLKNTVLAPAVSQYGKTIVTDVAKAMELTRWDRQLRINNKNNNR